MAVSDLSFDDQHLMRPDEVEDAIAYGVARLANTPIEQLQAQAATYRAARGLPPRAANDMADMSAFADALGIDRTIVFEAWGRAGGDLDLFMHLLDIDPAQLEAALKQVVDPATWAMFDAFAYGLAKLLHTPLGELKAEADAHRSSPLVVGSKAGSWANQAMDYALNADAAYVATAYMKPVPGHIYDVRSRWVVYVMPTRQDLEAWYQSIVGSPDRYHYLAIFDKTSPEWSAGRAVASSAEPGAYTSGAAIGASIEQQLHHLDQIIGLHETYWAALAQEAPTPAMRDFLRRYWDPFFSQWWWAYRPYLDRFSTEQVSHFVHQGAEQLSRLREFAAMNGIHTPDLGTTQHGFIPSEGLKVSGGQRSAYNAGRSRKRP